MPSLSSAAGLPEDADLAVAAAIAVRDSLKVQPDEKVLIITNPERDALRIAAALYDAAAAAGARTTLLLQPVKSQMDEAEDAVIAAFDCGPDVVMSLSAQKLGKDREGIRTPYEWNGVDYDHVLHYQLRGAKTLRAFWSPGITRDMFVKTVPIDYSLLRARCAAIRAVLDAAVSVRVVNRRGTDITLGLRGRAARPDDGDFSTPGSGGNLPAGEVFVSPELGSARGTIVFDLSMADIPGDILIREPIRCAVDGGFVKEVSGGPEADRLAAALAAGAEAAARMGAEGRLPEGKAAAYARDAYSIGELGIGLNPAAAVVGNMLEDEKAFRTCHFAIGSNYDEDAPALIHLDGLVSLPTIVAVMEDGREVEIEVEGELRL